MIKVRIFEGYNPQTEINQFLEARDHKLISVTPHSMVEYFEDGRVANQWIQWVVIYKEG